MRFRIAAVGGLVVLVALAIGGYVWIHRGFSARDQPSAAEIFLARQMKSLAVPSSAKTAPNPIPLTPEVLTGARAHFADHSMRPVTRTTDAAIPMSRSPMPIAPTADTMFVKSGKAAAAKDLKVGDRVVVDVVKKGNEMVANAAKFGAATAPEPAAHQHKSGQ